MFENFKKINLISGNPSMTISKNGVAFSKNAVYKMDRTQYVNILLDADNRKMAIKKCSDNDPDAVLFVRDFDKPYVRWNNHDFIQQIGELMSWEIFDTKCNYKIDGQYIAEENAILFDLDKAEISE